MASRSASGGDGPRAAMLGLFAFRDDPLAKGSSDAYSEPATTTAFFDFGLVGLLFLGGSGFFSCTFLGGAGFFSCCTFGWSGQITG